MVMLTCGVAGHSVNHVEFGRGRGLSEEEVSDTELSFGVWRLR